MGFLDGILAKIGSADLGKLLFRLGIGGLMLFHGVKKLMNGIDGIKAMTVRSGLPEFVAYGVYVGEVLAPILIIIGLCTRTASLIFAGTMGFAIYMAHASDIFALGKTGAPVIELPLLYLILGIALMMIGPGKYSFDAKKGRV